MFRRFTGYLGSFMGKRSKGGYYAVRIGRTTGVFSTWDECREAVNGVSGARYKKFSSHEEATDFVNGSDSSPQASSSRSSSWDDTSTKRCYSRPSQYNTSNTQSPKNTFKHTTRRTKYLDHIPSAQALSSFCTISSSPSSEGDRPVVYSDGCCTNNGHKGAQAGVGVYWGPGHESNISEKLHGPQTNQRAEIIAACRALESAKALGYKSVEVRTDSKYTINGVTDWINKWKSNGWKTSTNSDVKNVEDFQKLDKLCEDMDVRWTHVRGHSGHHGNEMADSLAKAGSRLT